MNEDCFGVLINADPIFELSHDVLVSTSTPGLSATLTLGLLQRSPSSAQNNRQAFMEPPFVPIIGE